MDLESVQGILSMSWECSLDGMARHHKAPCVHTFITRGNLASQTHMHVFGMWEGNWRTRKKPIQTQGRTCKETPQ